MEKRLTKRDYLMTIRIKENSTRIRLRIYGYYIHMNEWRDILHTQN